MHPETKQAPREFILQVATQINTAQSKGFFCAKEDEMTHSTPYWDLVRVREILEPESPTLPPGLPELPPLPDGFERWEYGGTECTSAECPAVSASLLYRGGYPNYEMHWHVYFNDGPVSRNGTHWLKAIPATPPLVEEGDDLDSNEVIDPAVRLNIAAQSLNLVPALIAQYGWPTTPQSIATASFDIADALIAAARKGEGHV